MYEDFFEWTTPRVQRINSVLHCLLCNTVIGQWVAQIQQLHDFYLAGNLITTCWAWHVRPAYSLAPRTRWVGFDGNAVFEEIVLRHRKWTQWPTISNRNRVNTLTATWYARWSLQVVAGRKQFCQKWTWSKCSTECSWCVQVNSKWNSAAGQSERWIRATRELLQSRTPSGRWESPDIKLCVNHAAGPAVDVGLIFLCVCVADAPLASLDGARRSRIWPTPISETSPTQTTLLPFSLNGPSPGRWSFFDSTALSDGHLSSGRRFLPAAPYLL